MRSHSRDNFLQGSQGAEGGSNETDGRNQVVAVGTPLATVVGTQQGPVMVRVMMLSNKPSNSDNIFV